MSPSSPSLDPQAHRAKFRIVLFEGIHPAARELLEDDDFEVEAFPGSPSKDELRRLVRSTHFIGIRSKTHLTADVLEEAKHLLAIGCFCIGTNQVDLNAARLGGVPVFNAPFSNTRSVAELVMSEVVALARRIGDRSREMHEGVWKKSAAGCYEVRGKTLGIVGYGHIGTQVGVLA
ncbi:MAG: phosphoglycerate dehydrogenase, partial [Candidatus Competibacteraceae bacterium]|nr:phosphoglycerate dehydrogenase [Candidatus Competibacteraceae bacterium]